MGKIRIFVILLTLLLLGVTKLAAPEAYAASKKAEINMVKNHIELCRYNNELEKFCNQIDYDESRNDWKAINKIGALGAPQFMNSTLKFLGYGYITTNKFRENPNIFPPELQRKVLKELIEVNYFILKDYINYYDGLEIKDIIITKSGILAAAHLGGPNSVILFLVSNGNINKRDIFGTSIKNYLIKYQNYDLWLRLI